MALIQITVNTVTVAPATGDNSQTGLYIALAVIAAAAIAALLLLSKKNKNK